MLFPKRRDRSREGGLEAERKARLAVERPEARAAAVPQEPADLLDGKARQLRERVLGEGEVPGQERPQDEGRRELAGPPQMRDEAAHVLAAGFGREGERGLLPRLAHDPLGALLREPAAAENEAR
jgi:hypothetical protein